ncbi:unnamed protein product [Pocillopora meandrina]|uniref:Uncharacterized protein n=1 Tax=Pocillopora meandrina TaxID=46732 RepID=A0AAU9XS32_9CNID|nr:unnamed protein product [Pocillopora meandrina]
MEMIENWKNNEQSEQNNSKVAVDFTSGKTMAHKVWLQEILPWFTKEKHYSIEDLVKSAIKLSVSDVLDTNEASLIPGEAVEANLADLKRFITDGAWKAVCKLG